MLGFNSGVSILFYQSMHPFLCQYHAVFITMAFVVQFEIQTGDTSSLVLFSQDCLAIQGLLQFYTNVIVEETCILNSQYLGHYSQKLIVQHKACTGQIRLKIKKKKRLKHYRSNESKVYFLKQGTCCKNRFYNKGKFNQYAKISILLKELSCL